MINYITHFLTRPTYHHHFTQDFQVFTIRHYLALHLHVQHVWTYWLFLYPTPRATHWCPGMVWDFCCFYMLSHTRILVLYLTIESYSRYMSEMFALSFIFSRSCKIITPVLYERCDKMKSQKQSQYHKSNHYRSLVGVRSTSIYLLMFWAQVENHNNTWYSLKTVWISLTVILKSLWIRHLAYLSEVYVKPTDQR